MLNSIDSNSYASRYQSQNTAAVKQSGESAVQNVRGTADPAASKAMQTAEAKQIQDASSANQPEQAIKLASKVDKVEISTQGRAALEQSKAEAPKEQRPAGAQQGQVPSASRPNEPSTQQAAAARTEAQTAATLKQTSSSIEKETSSSSAAASSSTDLSSLNEEQINKLVTQGTITKAEAETELAKRQPVPADNRQAPLSGSQGYAEQVTKQQVGALYDEVA